MYFEILGATKGADQQDDVWNARHWIFLQLDDKCMHSQCYSLLNIEILTLFIHVAQASIMTNNLNEEAGRKNYIFCHIWPWLSGSWELLWIYNNRRWARIPIYHNCPSTRTKLSAHNEIMNVLFLSSIWHKILVSSICNVVHLKRPRNKCFECGY